MTVERGRGRGCGSRHDEGLSTFWRMMEGAMEVRGLTLAARAYPRPEERGSTEGKKIIILQRLHARRRASRCHGRCSVAPGRRHPRSSGRSSKNKSSRTDMKLKMAPNVAQYASSSTTQIPSKSPVPSMPPSAVACTAATRILPWSLLQCLCAQSHMRVVRPSRHPSSWAMQSISARLPQRLK